MRIQSDTTPCKSQSLGAEPGPNNPCKSGDGGQPYSTDQPLVCDLATMRWRLAQAYSEEAYRLSKRGKHGTAKSLRDASRRMFDLAKTSTGYWPTEEPKSAK